MTARDWADEKAKEILHKCRWADATYNADVIALAFLQAHAKGRAEAFAEAAKICQHQNHESFKEYCQCAMCSRRKLFEAKAKEG